MGLFKKGNPTMSETRDQVVEQIDAHGIEFGEKYRDPASGFEGVVVALYFFEHGCMRVNLRGHNESTGGALEQAFDAPELVRVVDEKPVPAGSRTGGPHDLSPVSRPG